MKGKRERDRGKEEGRGRQGEAGERKEGEREKEEKGLQVDSVSHTSALFPTTYTHRTHKHTTPHTNK